jgi:23S rRNA (uridine2552-2'-O)-methyltransferase
MDAIDPPRGMYLAELALDFARQILKPIAAILIKTIHGAGSRKLAESAHHPSPRAASTRLMPPGAVSELYLLASGFRMV